MAFIVTPVQQCNIQQPDPIIEPVVEYKTSNHVVLKEYESELGFNCWEYVKAKAELPQGLFTLEDKKNKIKTKVPEIGRVGVTSEGPLGHLVYIEKIEDDGIVISEGNYKHGYITWRKVKPELILGYL